MWAKPIGRAELYLKKHEGRREGRHQECLADAPISGHCRRCRPTAAAARGNTEAGAMGECSKGRRRRPTFALASRQPVISTATRKALQSTTSHQLIKIITITTKRTRRRVTRKLGNHFLQLWPLPLQRRFNR